MTSQSPTSTALAHTGKIILSLILLMFAVHIESARTLEFQNLQYSFELDTAYLPYSFDIDREITNEDDCSYPEYTYYKIFQPAIDTTREGLIIFSNNPSPNIKNNSQFNPKSYPEFKETDDDPIRYTITKWSVFNEPSSGDPLIIGICHNTDSAFIFTLNEATDDVQYKLLYANDTDDDFIPYARIFFFDDLDKDDTLEIICYIEYPGHFRRLYAVAYSSLEKEWEQNIASGIGYIYLFDNEQTGTKNIFAATRNSANGVQDSIFKDFYSYVLSLNAQGKLEFLRTVGVYGRLVPVLIKSEIPDEYFMIHYLDLNSADSTTGKTVDQYYISRINNSGVVLQQIIVKSSPIDIQLIYDNTNTQYLFLRYRSKEICIYDMNLQPVDLLPSLPIGLIYFGKCMIPGETDSVYVFQNGIYDHTLTKIAQFPFISHIFDPVQYDSTGNVQAFMITNGIQYLIIKPRKKTTYQLMSVFYHRNQSYVVIAVTALLVCLIVVGYYQRKTKNNLSTISRQKKELEQTHAALREAQATIVAQEKFQQAKNIAGGFAHEIRNSLFPAKSAVSKLIDLDRTELLSIDYLKKISRITNNAVTRAISLTEHISHYTKLEADKKSETVELTALIKEVVEANRLELDNQHITVTLDLPEPIYTVASNEQFYIVFNNILLNAFDAVQNVEKPFIEIKSTLHDNKFKILITDNGCGIPEKDREKIFDFFYSTKPATGIGIGLSMVKKILELYNCTIDYEDAVQQGTVCVIRGTVQKEWTTDEK